MILCLLSSQACPLNAWPVSGAERTSQEIWESFSQCFTPAVKEVVEFAKGIPGFQELSQQDQVMLLKSGTFQVISHFKRFILLFSDSFYVYYCIVGVSICLKFSLFPCVFRF